MGAINLPPSLDQMFNDLGDRISRVETGYSSPQASADAAQGTAVQASTQSTQAMAQAVLAIQYANTAISQATYAIATANSASAQAIQASLQAGQAQTSANGKSTSHYSTSGPSGTGADGDLWFQTDSGGTVLYQFIYKTATGWTSAPISNSVIANLDAGKINAGVITGIAYNNGSGTFAVTAAGALTATQAVITGNITATSGTFTGAVYASSGTFTGAVYASSGTFTGSITGSTITGSLIRTASSGTRVEIPASSEIINFYAGSESSSEAGSIYAFSTTISGYSASETIVTAPDPASYGSTQPGTLATYNASDHSSGVIMNGTANYVNTGTFKIYQNFTGLTGSSTGSYVRNAYIRPTSDGNPVSGGINGDLWFQY